MPFDDARVLANTGMRGSSQRVMKPLWNFARHGESRPLGLGPVPGDRTGTSMTSASSTRCTPRGSPTGRRRCSCTAGRRPPSGRRWVRGSCTAWGPRTENLPGFVTISPSAGNGGARNYGNAFLPAVYQGTALGKAGAPASEATHPQPRQSRPVRRPPAAASFDLLREPERRAAAAQPGDAELEAVVASYELAWRMQMHAPDVLDLAGEIEGDARRSTASATSRDRQLRPPVPAGPPAVRIGRAVHPGDLRRQHGEPGLGPALEPAQARRPRPRRRPADRRPAGRPEASRAA